MSFPPQMKNILRFTFYEATLMKLALLTKCIASLFVTCRTEVVLLIGF